MPTTEERKKVAAAVDQFREIMGRMHEATRPYWEKKRALEAVELKITQQMREVEKAFHDEMDKIVGFPEYQSGWRMTEDFDDVHRCERTGLPLHESDRTEECGDGEALIGIEAPTK